MEHSLSDPHPRCSVCGRFVSRFMAVYVGIQYAELWNSHPAGWRCLGADFGELHVSEEHRRARESLLNRRS